MVKFLFKGTWPPGQFQAVNTAPHPGPPVFIVEGETNLVSRCKKNDTEKKLPKVKKQKNVYLITGHGWTEVRLSP